MFVAENHVYKQCSDVIMSQMMYSRHKQVIAKLNK